jgi:hypothetical protein
LLVQETELFQQHDLQVLEWAAAHKRVVVTHDVNTMTKQCISATRGRPATARGCDRSKRTGNRERDRRTRHLAQLQSAGGVSKPSYPSSHLTAQSRLSAACAASIRCLTESRAYLISRLRRAFATASVLECTWSFSPVQLPATETRSRRLPDRRQARCKIESFKPLPPRPTTVAIFVRYTTSEDGPKVRAAVALLLIVE